MAVTIGAVRAIRDFCLQPAYNESKPAETTMLDLAPETETTVRDYAAREGVSVEVFARRLLSRYAQQRTAAQRRAELEADAARYFAASGEIEEEMEAYVVQSVQQVRSEMRAQEVRP